MIGRSVTNTAFTKGIHNDEKFERFEKWLRENGAEYPHVELCSMGSCMEGVWWLTGSCEECT